jgi:hypothetical protein
VLRKGKFLETREILYGIEVYLGPRERWDFAFGIGLKVGEIARW